MSVSLGLLFITFIVMHISVGVHITHSAVAKFYITIVKKDLWSLSGEMLI